MKRTLLVCVMLAVGTSALCSCGKELTMETLLELYEEDGLARKAEREGLEGFLSYGNMKQASGMEDSLTGMYSCELTHLYMSEEGTADEREYELQLYYWRPETAEEYGHAENEIDNILLMEKETGDAVSLYEVDERVAPAEDLHGFLQRDYGAGQYLSCEMPDGFTLGKFQSDIAFYNGWMLEGDIKEPPHDDGIPEAWYRPGGIGRGETASQVLKFENGALTDASLQANHMEQLGETEILGGCEVQAILMEYAFELFTASSWEEYSAQYPGTEEMPQSRYWYVFFGKEESEIFYTLFLDKEYFTKDDAIRMARSVRFTRETF